jgi:hypothetical protein
MAGRVGACPKCKNKVRIPELETIAPEDLPEERVTPAPKRVATVQPSRSPRDFEEDEDDERPARPRRRPSDDADDRAVDNEPAPRRRKKRRKKRRSESSSGFASFLSENLLLSGLIGVGILMLLVCGVAFIFPPIALLPIGLGWLMMIVCNIWFIVCAFQDDVLQGVLCFLVPFYSLYYLITHFEEVKMPFFGGLIGALMIMGGSCAAGVGGASWGSSQPQGVHGGLHASSHFVA